MKLLHTLSEGSSSYLNGFSEISHFSTNTAKENALAGLKIATYLTLIAPFFAALTWGLSSLIEQCIDPNYSSETSDRVSKAAAGVFDKEKDISFIREKLKKIPSIGDLRKQFQTACDKDMEKAFNPPMTKILPGFYLGMQTNAGVDVSDKERSEAIKELKKNNIEVIIDCSSPKGISEDKQISGITHVSAYLGDTKRQEDFIEQYAKVSPIIEKARQEGKGILIHCNAGASRSPSMVIAYLISLGLYFDEAYRYVKANRLVVDVVNFESTLTAMRGFEQKNRPPL